MKIFYISKEVIANNFRFVSLEGEKRYKLYPNNDNILKYMNYATTYDNYHMFKEDKSYINSCHISKTKLTKNDEVISEKKNLDNRVLFFEFPDDYSEEELFYFCMKYSAEKLI